METNGTEAKVGEVARYVAEIKIYERETQKWTERSKKIIQRYKDSRPQQYQNVKRFNVLWSNIQVLLPALYAKNPKPDIERRFQDEDGVGRVTSEILERGCSYFIDEDNFFNVVRQAVLDRLLPGRGVIWVRYVPHFKSTVEDPEQVSEDAESVTEELSYEEISYDYVNYMDFGHNICRTFEEMYLGWRKVYMAKDDLVKRFGDIGKTVPLDHSPENLNDEKIEEANKKATIYELWDLRTKQVYWIHKSMQEPLDVKDDPLHLRGFFPFPKPLFATLANDSLIPVPDYVEYQDQANELDELTARIGLLTKALKVAGVYDSSAAGLERLLGEGVENILIPVEQFAVLGEKGGLDGVISFLPMDKIATTLKELYAIRDQTKQDLYEITGISDIIRGATDAKETATAQQIKGQFASLRLDNMQADVAKFCRDLVRITAEIIAEHFSLDTIKQISGIQLLTEQEKTLAATW